MGVIEATKDEELVKAVLTGNVRAFDTLVERYFGMVYALAWATARRLRIWPRKCFSGLTYISAILTSRAIFPHGSAESRGIWPPTG